MAEVVEQEIRDDEIAEGIEAEIESAAKVSIHAPAWGAT